VEREGKFQVKEGNPYFYDMEGNLIASKITKFYKALSGGAGGEKDNHLFFDFGDGYVPFKKLRAHGDPIAKIVTQMRQNEKFEEKDQQIRLQAKEIEEKNLQVHLQAKELEVLRKIVKDLTSKISGLGLADQ